MKNPTKIITEVAADMDNTLQAVINHVTVTIGKEKARLEVRLYVNWIYPFAPGRSVEDTSTEEFRKLFSKVRDYANKEGFFLYAY